MAFPQVATSSSGGTAANATAHTVTLPTGSAAGNLLVVLFGQDGTGTASVTTPATGWTVSSLGVNETRLSLLWRVADGNEAATITVTTDSQCVSWTAYRITGADTGTSPEFPTGATGSTNVPNPPSRTASWGSADNLFIAVTGWDINRTVTAYPANYTANQLTNQSGNATHGTGIASATRELAAATDDPGTFTISAADGWVASTIVIKAGVAVETGSGEALAGPALVEGTGAFVPSYPGSGALMLSPPVTEGTGSLSDPPAGHPVGILTQRRFGLSGPRYGSFAGKGAAAADDGSGALQVPGAQVEGTGAFSVTSYDGSGSLLLSPPLVEGTGAIAFPSYTGSGAILVSAPLVEGTGAIAVDAYTGSGTILVSPPLLEGTGAIAFPSYTGAGEILLSPPLVDGTADFSAAGEESGAGDVQVSPPLIEGTGVYADSALQGYPQIMGTPICGTGTASATHVITLPAGIQVGELITIFFVHDINGTVATVTDPASGWTEVYAITEPFHFTEIFYRRADGTEGATITVTLTNAQPAAWTAYRIDNVHLTQPFHVHTATTYGFTNTIDVPPSTVPWGVEKTLWIAVGAWEGAPTLSTYPANHPDQRITCAGGLAGTMGIFTAARYEETATENPDPFTISATTQVAGSVVAFRTEGEGEPMYSGTGEILLSPPLTAATGGFAGVGEESGAGDILVPGALLEGLGAFVEGPEPEVYIGVMGTCPEWATISGDTIVTISGDSITLANECETLLSGLQFVGSGSYSLPTGSGEILLPPPQVEGVGDYVDPFLGTADLQLAGLQFQATGLYSTSPCTVSANIDLGPLVSCNTQGQALTANKDC